LRLSDAETVEFDEEHSIPKVPDEVTALVHRGAEPGELAIVEHSIEEHDPLDHASLRGGLPEAVVGLADGSQSGLYWT
jgi:hypothetical protein